MRNLNESREGELTMLKNILLSVAMVLLVHTGIAVSGEGSDLVIDSRFVNDKLGMPGWVILDGRSGDEYRRCHIQGSINFSNAAADALRDSTDRAYTVIPGIEKTLGDAGIGDDKNIIVYGNAADVYETAVTFWILEFLGCNSPQLSCTVHYYDGGIEQWEANGGKLVVGDSSLPKAQFKSRVVVSRLATSEEVLRVAKGQTKVVLIDARTDAEYHGSDIRALRGGHIPGAVNITVQKNYDENDYKMLPLPELKALYKDIPMKERVIAYCQTGTRAAYTYLILRQVGYENVAVYDDSWIVYGSNVNYPAEDEQWFNFMEVNRTVKEVKELNKELLEQRQK
jgi:thiosulfate/3-mercaptopyruvate sulfurtransferase